MYTDKQQAAYLGRLGEEKVAQFLRSEGYIIVKRNWCDRYGEVDIIAEKGDILAFVEVKTRAEGAMVSGAEAIDSGKMRRTKNAALMFTKRMFGSYEPRVDVAEVIYCHKPDGSIGWRLKYFKSAF